MRSDAPLEYVIHRCNYLEFSLYFLWMRYRLRVVDKLCVKCVLDIYKDEGYLEGKHWTYCPYCGSELVVVLGYPQLMD